MIDVCVMSHMGVEGSVIELDAKNLILTTTKGGNGDSEKRAFLSHNQANTHNADGQSNTSNTVDRLQSRRVKHHDIRLNASG